MCSSFFFKATVSKLAPGCLWLNLTGHQWNNFSATVSSDTHAAVSVQLRSSFYQPSVCSVNSGVLEDQVTRDKKTKAFCKAIGAETNVVEVTAVIRYNSWDITAIAIMEKEVSPHQKKGSERTIEVDLFE